MNLLDYTLDELVAELKIEKFRGRQIFDWVKNGETAFERMSNLPKSLRERLSANYTAEAFSEIGRRCSADGTLKILGEFSDRSTVEAVLMKYRYGYSACISTQVGCRMGCDFCASAKSGYVRNLTAGELLGEVHLMSRIAGERLSNLVLMGMGEPLDNYDNVTEFLRRLSDPLYYGMSLRNVTVSTCGLVDGIDKLASERFSLTLALSLHNPFQAERERIMPVARRYRIEEIMDATWRYFDRTGRRITIEYALIGGNNDLPKHANELIRLIRDRNVSAYHVNLIPLNNHEYTEHRGSQKKEVLHFKNRLEESGIHVTIRRELGSDIEAACGQLKNNWRNYG